MKNQTFKSVRTLARICLVGLGCCAAGMATAQTYAIDRFCIAGGGGTCTGGVYTVSGTLGQPEYGVMNGDRYTLQGGFWAVVQTADAPRLSIERVPDGVRLCWPLSADNFVLEEAGVLTGPLIPTQWQNVTSSYQTNDSHISVTLPILPGNKFFRLRKDP